MVKLGHRREDRKVKVTGIGKGKSRGGKGRKVRKGTGTEMEE